MFLIGLMVLVHASDSEDRRADRKACGLYSLTLVSAFLGEDVGLDDLEKTLPLDRAPFSYRDIENAATHVGLKTFLVHWNDKRDATFSCPSILHIRANRPTGPPDHFLACFGETAEGLVVAEFPHPPFVLSRSKLEPLWDGDVLYVERPDGAVIDGLRRRVLLDRAGRTSTYVLAGTLVLFALWSWRPWALRRGTRRDDPTALA